MSIFGNSNTAVRFYAHHPGLQTVKTWEPQEQQIYKHTDHSHYGDVHRILGETAKDGGKLPSKCNSKSHKFELKGNRAKT